MESNHKLHFFYYIPPVEQTEAESNAFKIGAFCFFGGIFWGVCLSIFTNTKSITPFLGFCMGIGLVILIVLSQIDITKNAKKRKQYIPEFDKTFRTFIVETKLEEHDEEDDKNWGCYFNIVVKNPNTQKTVTFSVLDLKNKRLEDCEAILKTYESAQVGFEVTVKLHPTDKDALCLVLYEHTSPYLNFNKNYK